MYERLHERSTKLLEKEQRLWSKERDLKRQKDRLRFSSNLETEMAFYVHGLASSLLDLNLSLPVGLEGKPYLSLGLSRRINSRRRGVTRLSARGEAGSQAGGDENGPPGGFTGGALTEDSALNLNFLDESGSSSQPGHDRLLSGRSGPFLSPVWQSNHSASLPVVPPLSRLAQSGMNEDPKFSDPVFQQTMQEGQNATEGLALLTRQARPVEPER